MSALIKFPKLLVVLGLWVVLGIHSDTAFAEIRVGLVLDKGGKDDKSFNSAAYQGAMRVKSELKAFVKYVEATDDNAFEPLLRSLAQKNFDIIIAIGVSQVDAVQKVASQFSGQRFAIIDGEVKSPNVKSLLFEEHEGSYLVGAIAAMKANGKSVGFIGGMDIPLIRRFDLGYSSGAKAINPSIKVVSNYVGVTADAWNNPAKAKELAVSQYNSGVEVIFSAAGASGSGIFDAAEEKKKFAIGVDSNQNWVKPGFVLTSMVKRIDQAVYNVCQEVLQGKFVAGTVRHGLFNQGVDYTLDSYNEKIFSPQMRERITKIKADVISGKIKVPDYYKNRMGKN